MQNRVLLLLVLDEPGPKDEDEPPMGLANEVGMDGLGIEDDLVLNDVDDGPFLKNVFTGGVKR